MWNFITHVVLELISSIMQFGPFRLKLGTVGTQGRMGRAASVLTVGGSLWRSCSGVGRLQSGLREAGAAFLCAGIHPSSV